MSSACGCCDDHNKSLTCHDCKIPNTFTVPITTSSNEILLRLDHCGHVDENEIPNLFKYMDKYLPGYRFDPTDDQLITHYLRKKIANQHVPSSLISDVNLYQHHPKDLAERYPRHDSYWYFFTPRDRKYPNGSRPNRATGSGYWKATGQIKPVKVIDETVGFKRALVFYEGKARRGVKTNWIMNEFNVESGQKNSKGDMRLDDWILCRIHYTNTPLKKEKVTNVDSVKANHVDNDMKQYDGYEYDNIIQEVTGAYNAEANHIDKDMIQYDAHEYGDIDALQPDLNYVLGESSFLSPDGLQQYHWPSDNFDFTNFD